MPEGEGGWRQAVWQSASTHCRMVAAAVLAAACVTPVAAADVEFGRYLSSECMTCHGQAKTGDTIPNIFGMAESTFVEVVNAYRDKRLENQVMQTIAGRLSDEEIAALAAFFATANKPQ